MQVLPLTTEPIQIFEVQLDNIIYKFRVIYNTRGDYWTFDISNANDEPLAAGIKIVLGVDLIRAYRLDMGSLIAVNISDNQEDPGSQAALGTDVLLYHLNSTDFDELRSHDI